MILEIIRGDDYFPLRTFTVGQELTDCTVFVTYKPEPTDPNLDPDDQDAIISHYIVIDDEGSVTDSLGLTIDDLLPNQVNQNLTNDETVTFPLGVEYHCDVQVVRGDGKVKTYLQPNYTLIAIDGYTNKIAVE